jgi:TFIIF-interacting CTD phosphatase-like protein
MSADEKRQAEDISGISNVTYDLLATLTAKLEGIAAMEEYIDDARDEGADDVVSFFQDLQQRDTQDVNRLRDLVKQYLG